MDPLICKTKVNTPIKRTSPSIFTGIPKNQNLKSVILEIFEKWVRAEKT